MKRLLVCLAAILLLAGCAAPDMNTVMSTAAARNGGTAATASQTGETHAVTSQISGTSASAARTETTAGTTAQTSASASMPAVSEPPAGGWNYYTDCQTGLYSSQGLRRDVAESEDGLYLLRGSFLYFYDYASGLCVPLCSRSNCLHDAETDAARKAQCEAYLEGGMETSIFWQSERLYALTSQIGSGANKTVTELVEIRPDGSQRRTVYRFEGAKAVSGPEACVHRGRMYLCRTRFDEKMQVISELTQVSLTDGAGETLYEERQTDAGNLSSYGLFSWLTAVGDELYFITDHGGEQVPMRLSLTTGGVRPLLDEGFEERLATLPVYMGDRIFFSVSDTGAAGPAAPTVIAPVKGYICDPDGGGITPWTDVPPGIAVADGEYLYVLDLNMFKYPDREARGLRIYDRGGAPVQDIPLEKRLPGWQALYRTQEALLILTSVKGETHLYAFAPEALLRGEVEVQQIY